MKPEGGREVQKEDGSRQEELVSPLGLAFQSVSCGTRSSLFPDIKCRILIGVGLARHQCWNHTGTGTRLQLGLKKQHQSVVRS